MGGLISQGYTIIKRKNEIMEQKYFKSSFIVVLHSRIQGGDAGAKELGGTLFFASLILVTLFPPPQLV